MQRLLLIAVSLGAVVLFPAQVKAIGPQLSCTTIWTFVSVGFFAYGGCGADWQFDPGTCPSSDVAISGASCNFDYDLRSAAQVVDNRVVLGMEGSHTATVPGASQHHEGATVSFVLSPSLGTTVPVRIQSECIRDTNGPLTDDYSVVFRESGGPEIADLGCASATFLLTPGVTYEIDASGDQSYASAGDHFASLTVTVSYIQSSVPSLSPWALALLFVTMIGTGAFGMTKRRV